MSVTAPATGVLLGGRYRLTERIASGGMGTVWAAEDATLHRRVAVKVLNDALGADERFTERFRREARAAAGLSHPAIAGVYDYGEEDGRPYIVMELIDGDTLADRLQRIGALDPEETVRIGAAVADALAFAHAQGIVHRDVKPANIMFDGSDAVRVLDFGIAAPLEGSTGLTLTGTVLGTSRYISPEQAEGERAAPASDVYSLGVVLYETLVGEPPFVRETPVATALAHIHERPRPIRDVRPGTPPEIADVVQEALSKDPANRPSPEELAARLRDAKPSAASTMPVAAATETLPVPVVVPADPASAQTTPQRAAPANRTKTLRLKMPIGTMRPDRPPRDRRIRWLIGATLVALLVVIVGVVASSSAKKVGTPHLVGLYRQAAVTRARQLGFDPVVQWTTSDLPRGEVLRQRPYAGAKVPKGIPIVLFVSSGPATVASPSPIPTAPSPKPPKPPKGPPGHEKHHGHGEGHD